MVCGDLRADAADDALGAHEPRGGDGLEQVLRHQRIHRGHAGDVDDGDLGAGLHDPLQQALHHDLGARAVERADHRQRQDAVPQLDDRRRQLEHLLLLPGDDLLSRLLVDLGGVEARACRAARWRSRSPRSAPAASPPYSSRSALEERLLQREDEGGGLRRREAPRATGPRDIRQPVAHSLPGGPVDAVERTLAYRAAQEAKELARLVAQLAVRDDGPARERSGELDLDPLVEDIGFTPLEELRQTAIRHGRHLGASVKADSMSMLGRMQRAVARLGVVRTYGAAGRDATGPGYTRGDRNGRTIWVWSARR